MMNINNGSLEKMGAQLRNSHGLVKEMWSSNEVEIRKLEQKKDKINDSLFGAKERREELEENLNKILVAYDDYCKTVGIDNDLMPVEQLTMKFPEIEPGEVKTVGDLILLISGAMTEENISQEAFNIENDFPEDGEPQSVLIWPKKEYEDETEVGFQAAMASYRKIADLVINKLNLEPNNDLCTPPSQELKPYTFTVAVIFQKPAEEEGGETPDEQIEAGDSETEE